MDLNKNYFIVGFICLAIGASFSFFKKPEVQIKEVIKYEIKEVEKVKEQKDTFTKIKETKLKDGTIITETEITDKQITETEKNKDTNYSSSKEMSQKLINKHRIQLFQSINKTLDFHTELSYTYKVLNPFFIKANINDKLDYKIEAGVEVEF